MKFNLILIISLIAFIGNSQDTLTQYFDSDWEKTEQENASFYRKAYKADTEKWNATTYFFSGEIEMKGSYVSEQLEKKDGSFVHFYKNGKKKEMYECIKGDTVGIFQSWYASSLPYEKGQFDSISNKTGVWTYYKKDGTKHCEGTFINGKKEGEWIWYFENGQASSKENYTADEVGEYRFFDENGKELPKDTPYKINPKYGNGLDDVYTFLRENIVYPEIAKEMAIQGVVYISFIVDKDGSINSARVIRAVHPSLNKEALRVVNSMTDWSPAIFHNQLRKVRYTLPIRFQFS